MLGVEGVRTYSVVVTEPAFVVGAVTGLGVRGMYLCRSRHRAIVGAVTGAGVRG